MTAFSDALDHPRSVSRRRALAVEWAAQRDNRAPLITRQLALRDGVGFDDDHRISSELRELIAAHGAEWAGPIAEWADSYTFALGLVHSMKIDAAVFVEHAEEIFKLAAVQRLQLTGRLDAKALAAIERLNQLVHLWVTVEDGLDDDAARTLASCPHFGQLAVGYWRGTIGHDGIAAIARSRNFPRLICLELTGNPGVGAGGYVEGVQHVDDRWYLFGPCADAHWDKAIADRALTYNGQLDWPPDTHSLMFDEPGHD